MIRAAVFGPIPARCRACRPRPPRAARQRPDPERVPELAHPLRREPEQPGDADELRERLRLELVQLGEPPRLDELAEPRSIPGPIPASSRAPAGADERGDVGGRRADQVGRPAVGADGVVARAVEVEQGREGLEAVGEGCVVHD